jgi:HD superfamily phosphohydrolase
MLMTSPSAIVSEIDDALAHAIHDPVHKRIWVTRPELEIIDSPVFQRLRRVSQLGFADYVFPGATRTRFSHSLGALYVMGELLKAQKAKLASHLNREFQISWQAMRFAALLHDVGHLPFSHPTEFAYDRIRSPLNEKVPHELIDRASSFPDRGSTHERVAAEIIEDTEGDIYRIIKGELDVDTISMITTLIQGHATLSAVAAALVSSDLDADRLDYIMRDSDSAGFVFGLIDLDYLIENVEIGQSEGIDALAINARHGVGAFEHYLLARTFIYSQLVNHKAIAGAELLLRMVLLKAVEETKAFSAPTLPADEDEVVTWFRERRFHRLTDGHVLSRLSQECYEPNGKASPQLRELVTRLLERRLPKVAYSRIELAITDDDATSAPGIAELFATEGAKRELADKASAKGIPLGVSDFSFMKRDEALVKEFAKAERIDAEAIEPPKGALVTDPPTRPEVWPLDAERGSLLHPLKGYERQVYYVFVFEDVAAPYRSKLRTKALTDALADGGFA